MESIPVTLSVQDRLADARDKLHLFQTGRLSVEVEVDGRKVRYNRTNIDELRAYINTLTIEANGTYPRYGAVGVLF